MTGSSVPRPATRRLDRAFNLAWLLVAVAAVLLAVYVVVAGQVLSLMGERRADIAGWLGERLGMRVEIDQITGSMNLLTPELRLRGVRVHVVDGLGEPAFAAPEVEAHIDVVASLLARRPVLDLLRVQGVQLTLVEGEDGRFRAKGFPFDVNDPRAAERLRQALTVFYRQHMVVVAGSRLLLESPRLPVTALDNVTLRIINEGDEHRVAGEMTVLGAGRIPLSFVLQFKGAPLAPAELFADVYLRAQPSSLEGWLPRRDFGPLWLDALSAGGEAWLRIEGQRIATVSGRARIDNLAFSRADGGKVEGLLGLAGRFRWEPVAGGWRLALGGLGFRRQGFTWPETDAALEWQVDADGQRKVRAMFARGSVEVLAGLTDLLPPEQAAWRAALLRAAPRGQLGPVHFNWNDAAAPDARWRLAAGFSQLGLQPDGGRPGGSGLSGSLEVQPEVGRARLQARDGQFAMPSLFAETLPVAAADIDLLWDKSSDGGWRVRSGISTVATPDARANALFTLLLPPATPATGAASARPPPRLQLLGLIEDGDPRATPRYLPTSLSPGLRDWLAKALTGGRLARGSFLVDGPLGSDAAAVAARTFQMRYEGRDLALAFLPGWPSLTRADADVLIVGGRVDARASQGFLRESRLAGIQVAVIPRGGTSSDLTVRAQLDGDVADAFVLFRDTPLRASVPAELLRWDGNGRLVADVAVTHPLGGNSTQVTVAGTVAGAELQSTAHALTISDVSGRLRYDTQAGFSADDLRGRALGSNFSGDARTTRSDGGEQTRLDLRGRLHVAEVASWLKIPALDVLRGQADAAVQLRFGSGGKGKDVDVGDLEVRTDLRGISSTAPAPLAKPADTTVDTRLTVSLGTNEPRLRLVSGRALAADLQLKNGTPVSGMVALGSARLAPVSGPGLVIEGDLENLVLGDWTDFVARLGGGATGKADNRPPLSRAIAGLVDAGDRLRKVNIVADRLDTGAIVLDAATLRMGREEASWLVRIDSRVVRGQLVLPDGYQERGEKPLLVQVDSLNLPAAGRNGAGLAAVVPTEVPHLAMTLNNIRVGGEDYGSWSLETVPVKDGIDLRDVHGTWRALDIKGQGEWLAVAGGGTRSRFQGGVTAADLAAVSIAFGFQPQLSSSVASADVDLAWPGRPTDLDPARATGKMALDLRDGRFVSGSARTQALRALGVFNINTWQRRMKFDFSDLYRKGVAFDTLTGDIALDAGRLTTTNLVARGPSAIFEMSGNTVLDSSALQSRLRVTLPLNSNLYVGCLAGLAACAGIVAAEQLWGDRLEKMTTLVYDVGGTWADPVVKLVQGAPTTPGG